MVAVPVLTCVLIAIMAIVSAVVVGLGKVSEDNMVPLTDTVTTTAWQHVVSLADVGVDAVLVVLLTAVAVACAVLIDNVLGFEVGNAEGELGDVALHMPLLCRKVSHHREVEVWSYSG